MSLADRLRQLLKGYVTVRWTWRPSVLLSPNIPAPMHGLAPRVVLGAKWWDATRQAAYRSTAYHCIACEVWKGDARGHRWLEGHELYDIGYLLGRMVYVETVPLCNYCHNYVHQGRLQAMLEQKKITQARFVAIIQHGDAVLARAGLARKLPYEGPMADWDDWRLVVDGREFKPRYTLERWERKFSVQRSKPIR